MTYYEFLIVNIFLGEIIYEKALVDWEEFPILLGDVILSIETYGWYLDNCFEGESEGFLVCCWIWSTVDFVYFHNL